MPDGRSTEITNAPEPFIFLITEAVRLLTGPFSPEPIKASMYISSGQAASRETSSISGSSIDNTLQYIQHYEGLHFFNGLTTQSVIFRPNRPIPLDLGGIWNANPFTFNGSLLIALTDKEGNIKEELWDTTLSDLQSSYYTFYNDPITVTITEEICPGDRLRAFSRGEGDTEWRWIRGGYARFDPLLKLSDEILLMPDESATAVESIQSAADDIAILPAGEGRWCISASSPIERILWYSLSGQMLESTAGDGTTRMEVGRPAAGRLILRIVCREGSRSAIL